MTASRLLRPAVFLDRDGTLIEDRGAISDPSQIEWFEDTFAALTALARRFALFIVTNQPAVAEGRLTSDEVDRVNASVVAELARHGVQIRSVYVCPHRRADGCACIKPKPFFLHQAARDFAIDLACSFVIGDHPHDVELARNVGARGVFVRTGHGLRHLDEVPEGTPITGGIGEAAAWILDQSDRAPAMTGGCP